MHFISVHNFYYLFDAAQILSLKIFHSIISVQISRDRLAQLGECPLANSTIRVWLTLAARKKRTSGMWLGVLEIKCTTSIFQSPFSTLSTKVVESAIYWTSNKADFHSTWLRRKGNIARRNWSFWLADGQDTLLCNSTHPTLTTSRQLWL